MIDIHEQKPELHKFERERTFYAHRVDIVFQLVHQSWCVCVALKNTCRYMAASGARGGGANIISQRTTTQQREEVGALSLAHPPARARVQPYLKAKERTRSALTLIHTLVWYVGASCCGYRAHTRCSQKSIKSNKKFWYKTAALSISQ